MTVKRTMLQHPVIAPNKTVKVKAPLFNDKLAVFWDIQIQYT